jgi:hypothetical protein
VKEAALIMFIVAIPLTFDNPVAFLLIWMVGVIVVLRRRLFHQWLRS